VSGLSAGLAVWLFRELVDSLSTEQLTERPTLSPDEGMQQSLKNGLSGVPSGVLVGVLSGVLSGVLVGVLAGVLYGVLSGVLAGVLFGVLSGGLSGMLSDVVHHYILRFWLARAGVFPWQVVPFLEDATKRILLRRVGGGYRFAHALLQDYFEDLHVQAASTFSPSQQDMGSAPAEVTSQQG
ncbi:MAG: hypothetical protein IMW89_06790, partial [Ktedonobacteraceae bacterium]|nr:hypothetical protein [Ktedonobacteraceae bacterium]